MAKDHFVPRHYLRRFAVNGSEEIMAARLSSHLDIKQRGIGGQCQEDDFYEGDERLAKILWTCENDLAPVLVRVIQNESFTEPELVALRWLAVTLHTRTRKAAEAYKVFPKRMAYEFTKHAVESGALPPPPGGKLTEEILDVKGVSGLLAQSVIPCAIEMQTLACKLLKANGESSFITSDHPVAVLNQFCAGVEPNRSFVGFSKSGFQLLLPISPRFCLFFYDAKIYKVGSQRHRLVLLSTEDMDIVNSLQIQTAEECVFFHDPNLKDAVSALIRQYGGLRVSVQDGLRTIPGLRPDEAFFHFRHLSPKLPKSWRFCRRKRHINFNIGDRRDPVWSALIGELMDDLDKNPTGGDIHARMKRILADPNSLRNIRTR